MPVRLPPSTDRASRILLEGLVDYAGLFAPAALSMPNAVRNYAHYRAAGSGWILGRFICPAQSLERFSESADALLPRDAGAIPWRLSVTGSPDLAGDLAHIGGHPGRERPLAGGQHDRIVSAHDVGGGYLAPCRHRHQDCAAGVPRTKTRRPVRGIGRIGIGIEDLRREFGVD